MKLAWSMHLFIILLFSLSLSNGQSLLDEYNDEDYQSTTDLISEKRSDDDERWLTETPPLIKTTEEDALNDEYSIDDHASEEEEDSSTITSTSTTERILITRIILDRTTSSTEPPSTNSVWSPMTFHFDDSVLYSWTSTYSAREIAIYSAKANRERLLLKIFGIIVIVGMTSLAAALLTIHIIRQNRRYDEYGIPTTNKHSENMNI